MIYDGVVSLKMPPFSSRTRFVAFVFLPPVVLQITIRLVYLFIQQRA
jgi:hypothetical protein